VGRKRIMASQILATGQNLIRDVGTGPDVSVLRPQSFAAMTGEEVSAVMALADTHPTKALFLAKLAAGTAVSGQSRESQRFFENRVSPRFVGVGDSYAQGAGATGGNGYLQLLATEFASQGDWSNYGWAGYPMTKYSSAPLYSGTGAATLDKTTVTKDTVSLCMIGLNDLRGVGQAGGTDQNGCGPDPSKFFSLRSKVQALATALLIPETQRVRMRDQAGTQLNPAVTFTGSWVQTLNGNNSFVYTTGSGDTASGTTAVGNLLVIRFGRGSAETTNYFDLSVDGVAQPQIWHRAAYDGWAQDCVILRLPTTKAHTFTITARLPSGGACVLESVDCVSSGHNVGGTLIYGVPLYLNDGANVGWGLTGVTANSASANSATGATAWLYGDGASDRFEQAVDLALAELVSLGFNIIKADVKTGWQKNVMLNADTVHPNDIGHQHIKNAFARKLRQFLLL